MLATSTPPLTERLDSMSNASTSSSAFPKVFIDIVIPDHKWKFVFRVPTHTLVRDFLRRVLNVCHLDPVHYMNYGFYLPPRGGKKGKYLQEERLIDEYPQLCEISSQLGNGMTNNSTKYGSNSFDSGTVQSDRPALWFIRKCRYVNESPISLQRFKQVNCKHNQKQLMMAIRAGDLSKMEHLLHEGLDPNFQYYKSGDTPITTAAVQSSPKNLILKLVEHGAHLDYRDLASFTALHWAAMSGNLEGIRTLLDLGLSPNVRDGRDLTPLYRAVSRDVPTECVSTLLYDHAILGVTDDKNRQEIHQACLFDNPGHLEQLIIYGADLDARACNLDTPLHICALHNHANCMRLLLRAGADRELENASGQTPYQVAVLTGLTQLAHEIDTFSFDNVVTMPHTPTYNTDRKPSVFGPRGALQVNRSCPSLCSGGGYTNRSNTSVDLPCITQQTPFSPAASESSNGKYQGRTKTAAPLSHKSSSPQQHEHQCRLVTLDRQNSGFGFRIRGQKDPDRSLSESNKPANQYFDQIFPNTPAAHAGLRSGDYLLAVNDVDVRNASHQQVTDLILRSGNTVTLKVLSSGEKPAMRKISSLRIVDHRNSVNRRSGSLDLVPSPHDSPDLRSGRARIQDSLGRRVAIDRSAVSQSVDNSCEREFRIPSRVILANTEYRTENRIESGSSSVEEDEPLTRNVLLEYEKEIPVMIEPLSLD